MDVVRIESADGTPLCLYRWGESSRDILVVHGLAEHAERYAHVAQALVAGGFRANVLELRGHGQSGGKRGHVARWRRYAEDVWAATRQLGENWAMVAHSMGGLVALDALGENTRAGILGLALSNPLFGLAFQPPRIKVQASRLLSSLVPSLSLKNELDTSKLSRDPEVVRKYEADPRIFDTLTPRWYTEMRAAMERVDATAARLVLPLLLQVGEADGICDPKAANRFYQAWAGPKQIRRYPGLYHEIYNEPEKEAVLADLVAWLGTLPWEG